MTRKEEAFRFFDANPDAKARDADIAIGLGESTFYNYRKQWKEQKEQQKRQSATLLSPIDDEDTEVIPEKQSFSMVELIESAKHFVSSCGDEAIAKEALEAYLIARK